MICSIPQASENNFYSYFQIAPVQEQILCYLNKKSLLNLAQCSAQFLKDKLIQKYVSDKYMFSLPESHIKNLTTDTPDVLCKFTAKRILIDENIPKEKLIYFSKIIDITFDDDFDKPVDRLPNSITHLTFGTHFNQSVDNLPANLTHLTLGAFFNQPVDNLPANLTHLKFWQYFNQSVDNLPAKLTHLILGDNFNKSVNNLPANLTHLTLGFCFDNSVDELPHTLTHLTFKDNFNQSVDNLPKGITHLIFGEHFNQRVNSWPASIKYLKHQLLNPYLSSLNDHSNVNQSLDFVHN